jgi:uncharacterized protein YecT (DUF1311 family)
MRRSHCRAALPAQTFPAALGVLMVALGCASPAGAQSFDCRNARYADEKAICQDGRLGDLDKQLADTYDRAGSKLSKQERQQFETNETAFVNARHRCGGNQACIEQSYRNRMQELLSGLPEEQPGRSDRRGDTKAPDRQKTSRDTGKTEEVRTGPDETKREGAQTSPPPVERSTGQSEAKPALSSPSAETRSGREEPVKTGSAVPNPPSRREPEAALADSPPPEKHARHKRHTESVAASPAAPVREAPPAASAPAAPERHSSKSGNAAVSERHPAAAPSAPAPEKQPATGSSTAAAEPATPPDKKHSRVKHITASTPASGTSAPPAPADQGNPEAKPEIKWVNPSPSR